MDEHVERSRLRDDPGTVTAQLDSVDVERVTFEVIAHLDPIVELGASGRRPPRTGSASGV
jgi:hypothetical protein